MNIDRILFIDIFRFKNRWKEITVFLLIINFVLI